MSDTFFAEDSLLADWKVIACATVALVADYFGHVCQMQNGGCNFLCRLAQCHGDPNGAQQYGADIWKARAKMDAGVYTRTLLEPLGTLLATLILTLRNHVLLFEQYVGA